MSDWYSEKKQCMRCNSGVEPSWQQDGYTRTAVIIRVIAVETKGMFARIMPDALLKKLPPKWSGYITPEINYEEIKADLALCDGCWTDFEIFMKGLL